VTDAHAYNSATVAKEHKLDVIDLHKSKSEQCQNTQRIQSIYKYKCMRCVGIHPPLSLFQRQHVFYL